MPTQQTFGLWPIAMDRLTDRTGKIYTFAAATVTALSAADARLIAKSKDELGLAWDDPEIFACKPVAVFGDTPPAGSIYFQWTAL